MKYPITAFTHGQPQKVCTLHGNYQWYNLLLGINIRLVGIFLYQWNTVIIILFVLLDDEEGYYFGQEQVPLTDEIREILEEYPDGQIFKVRTYICSQNSLVVWSYRHTYAELKSF